MVGTGPDSTGAVTYFLSIQDAATLAHRDERTIRRWIAEGRLDEYRTPSGQRLVLLTDVTALEASMRSRRQRMAQERLQRFVGPV